MNTKINFDFTYIRGRVGLYAFLKALGVGRGDEVVLQAYTCFSFPEAILATGARAVYVDVASGGINMDTGLLGQQLTSRTRAIIAQHTFGIPAKMDQIMEVADEHGVPVIEDCAHSFWSEYDGKRVGHIGAATAYSFEWTKPLPLGIGGALVVRDDGLRRKIRSAYQQLELPPARRDRKMQLQYLAFSLLYKPERFWSVKKLNRFLSRGEQAGMRLDLGPSGLGDYRLRMLPSVSRRMKRRLPGLQPDWDRNREIIAAYRRGIAGAVSEIPVPQKARTMYARYPFWIDDKEAMLSRARSVGYELGDWFLSPVSPLTGENLSLAGYETGMCPNAERACRHVVSLPCNERVSVAACERFMSKLTSSPRRAVDGSLAHQKS
ncbi:MAG: DegT/DnrJ/EryC1/StrS family aminotransferase [Methyloligellaceae bacterium]